jgi:TATA-box binding protein (TBP) (component of TFIID and TFIIIB)
MIKVYKSIKEEHGDEERKDIPRVVNVVSTMHILPLEFVSTPKGRKRRYALSLPCLSMLLPGSQYAPSKFSSVIMRIKDDKDTFTTSWFKSGKSVIVRAQSPEHSRYISKIATLMLGNLQVLCQEEDGTIGLKRLGEFVQFSNWKVQNVVLHGNLGMRLKLEELRAAVPDQITYNPHGFPGAKYKLTVKDTCTCKGKEKCGCLATCVVFDSGAIIIAGSKTAVEGNAVFYRICQELPAYEDDDVAVPKEERWRTRQAKLIEYLARNANPVDKQRQEALKKRRDKKKNNIADVFNEEEEDFLDELLEEEDEENEIYMSILKQGEDNEEEIEDIEEECVVTEFMKACDQKNLDIVKLFLDSGMGGDPNARDADGNTALDRCRAKNDESYNPIIQYLIKHL